MRTSIRGDRLTTSLATRSISPGPMTRALIAMAPDRADLSKKKSHYLTSLAARSLARDDPRSAIDFLDYAERTLNPRDLTPFLLDERSDYRRKAQEAIQWNSPRVR